jgi:hypothetical protein
MKVVDIIFNYLCYVIIQYFGLLFGWSVCDAGVNDAFSCL